MASEEQFELLLQVLRKFEKAGALEVAPFALFQDRSDNFGYNWLIDWLIGRREFGTVAPRLELPKWLLSRR